MTYFGRRVGVGDMQKYVYDWDLDDKIDPNAIADHASKHEAGGADEMNCSGLAGRVNLVSRGEPDAYDFQVGDFITDWVWHDLDLSAIVPAGATYVYLRLLIQDDLVDKFFGLRKKGHIGGFNVHGFRTMVADISKYASFFVELDSNGVIQYKAATTTWTVIDLLVIGWVI